MKPPLSPPTPAPLPVEAHLGQALAILQRVLPRLEEAPQRGEIQAALRQTVSVIQQILPHLGDPAWLGDSKAALQRAAAHLESARLALEQTPPPLGEPVNGEVLAVISAAVATALHRPCRVLDVKRSAPVVTWVNAWAMEGRFQHYSSRRIR
jgi:hypothetical protein